MRPRAALAMPRLERTEKSDIVENKYPAGATFLAVCTVISNTVTGETQASGGRR